MNTRGVKIHLVLWGALALYYLSGGAFLLAGSEKSTSGACCLPPACDNVPSDAVFPLHVRGDSGLCNIQGNSTIAKALNCPSAVNLSKCNSVTHVSLCETDVSTPLITGLGVTSIILGSFFAIFFFITAFTRESVLTMKYNCRIWILMVFFICSILCAVFGSISLARIYLMNAQSHVARSCVLNVNNVCVLWHYAEFQSGGSESCDWVGQKAVQYSYVDHVEDMKRPALALTVINYVPFILVIAWLFSMCCGVFAAVERVGKIFDFLNGDNDADEGKEYALQAS